MLADRCRAAHARKSLTSSPDLKLYIVGEVAAQVSGIHKLLDSGSTLGESEEIVGNCSVSVMYNLKIMYKYGEDILLPLLVRSLHCR